MEHRGLWTINGNRKTSERERSSLSVTVNEWGSVISGSALKLIFALEWIRSDTRVCSRIKKRNNFG